MFCVSILPFRRSWPPQPYPLSPPCSFSYVRYRVYQNIHLAGIPLTLIGLPMLGRVPIKLNVDVGNTIFSSILFPVNAYVIKDFLKYSRPSPMISQVIPHVVPSSYIYGCITLPLMTCLIFHSSF